MADPDPELAAIRARILRELAAPDPALAPAAPAAPAVAEVTDASFQAALGAHAAFVLDCWAVWCGPCRVLSPIVEAVAGEMRGKVAFGKLDVDANPRVAQAYSVQSIPTLLFFDHGRYVDRLVGAVPKPALQQAIRQVFRIRGDGGRDPGVRRA